MNRKEFLQASAALIPMSMFGFTKAEARTQNTTAVPFAKSEQQPDGTLKFHSNGKFKIVQFTDVHWVPGNKESLAAKERMEEVLDAEKPDLVIFTGDVIYGKPALPALEEAFAPVVARKIPFSYTFGNHDDEQGMSRQEIYAYTKKWGNNLSGTTEGLSGVSNFILTVRSSDGQRDAFVLYHFDSLSYSPIKGVGTYDWIKDNQITWYRQNAAAFKAKNNNEPVPALAFFHIPFPEYNQAAQSERALLVGIRKEPACAPAVNSGLYTAMLESGDIMGTFVGHDHVNDYLTTWNGILLGYGRYTGGKTVYCDIPGGNGARVIELTEGKRELETWIHLKGGRITERISYPKDFSKNPW